MQQHKYTNIFTVFPSPVPGMLQLTAYCVQLYTLVHIPCRAKYGTHMMQVIEKSAQGTKLRREKNTI